MSQNPDTPTQRVMSKARRHGDTFEQFQMFKAECAKGTKIQLHGLDFVAVDRKTWEEMQAKLNPVKVLVDESPTLEPPRS